MIRARKDLATAEGRACINKGVIPTKKTVFMRFLIRMFTNFGRDIVFSADLCYNEANEEPSSGREGCFAKGKDGRSLRDFMFVQTSL